MCLYLTVAIDEENGMAMHNRRWTCSACHWEWQSRPNTQCPGLPRYAWASRPDHLQTKAALGREGFKLAKGQEKVQAVTTSH